VEPFEDADEIRWRWPKQGIILAADEEAGIEKLLELMQEFGRWLPIIAFSDNPAPRRVARAICSGSVDYVAWPGKIDELIGAIADAHAQSKVFGGFKLRAAKARSQVDQLSRREREVLAAVADGLPSRMIGERLAISPRTVEIHRANMLNKLGVRHTSEAIRIAVEAELT
jgi:FixJ family two-component response regulator